MLLLPTYSLLMYVYSIFNTICVILKYNIQKIFGIIYFNNKRSLIIIKGFVNDIIYLSKVQTNISL